MAAGETMPEIFGDGLVRTDLHCHSCSKTFIAEIDFRLDGCHHVECAHCGHLHFRVIKSGKVTEERHNDAVPQHVVSPRSVWKQDALVAQTSTAASFLRDLWLNRGDW